MPVAVKYLHVSRDKRGVEMQSVSQIVDKDDEDKKGTTPIFTINMYHTKMVCLLPGMTLLDLQT